MTPTVFDDAETQSLVSETGERPMNILMLFSDEHNAFMSGFMGDETVRTPNLDRLAREGTLFTDAYCNSPLCSPSRQSFMAGLYCHDIGVWNNTCSMPEDTVTWAHALSAAGYETSLIGKMHFNGYQKMYGFDHRPVLEGNQRGESFYSWGIRATHDWTVALPYRSGTNGMWDELTGAGADVMERDPIFQKDLEVLQNSLDFLLEKGKDPEGQPWAACLSFVLPHPPWKARSDILETYRGKGDLPFNHKGEGRDICDRYLQHFYGDVRNLSEDAIRNAREAYFALITEFDEYAGRILDALDANGLAENTVVVYFSDHGELAGKHGNWSKVSLLEDSVRVPMIIRWPGVSVAGARISAPVSLVDLYPTFLDVAGTKLPDILSLRGESLKPLLVGTDRDFSNREVFCEFEGEGWNHPRAMLRRGSFKYVHNHTAENRLYNLESDPDETVDLYADPSCSVIVNELQQGLFAHWDPEKVEKQVLQAQARMRLAYCKNVCKDLGW